MDEFTDIRPYKDSEVAAVVARLLDDPELLTAICKLKFKGLTNWLGWPLRLLVRAALRREVGGINDVRGLQSLIERYMTRMIEETTTGFTESGREQLNPAQTYLFMSNHRDIALDPAFTNYALFNNGFDTVRIAIGDNLLTKPWVSDLMRLNKSFIVQRSARGPRQILKAYRTLSAYIAHSLATERSSIWIAQREGRAKNGIDKTEPAIIKMLTMNQDKQSETFAEYIERLHIVPVSISYELDPCDELKAQELQQRAGRGSYEKAEHEDVASIATGIAGNKGHVHVAFGTPVGAGFETPEAVAREVDRQVINNYALHGTNRYAYKALHHVEAPTGEIVAAAATCSEADFLARIQAMPAPCRPYALGIYANAVTSKLQLEDVADAHSLAG